MKMRKSMFLMLMVFLMVLNTVAHSPSGIDIAYEEGKDAIAIRIVHTVSNPQTHFIDKIYVDVNDERVVERNFSSQNAETGVLTRIDGVDASDGDTIMVTADCSISGSETGDIVVGEDNPGFEGAEDLLSGQLSDTEPLETSEPEESGRSMMNWVYGGIFLAIVLGVIAFYRNK